MLRGKCTLVVLAFVLAGLSTQTTSAQQTAQSRQLPASLLHDKMKPRTGHPKDAFTKTGISKTSGIKSAVTIGTAGVDSVINWSDQFIAPGFDSSGNPQSVWPYTMVGTPPGSEGSSIRAPIIPVTVDLLLPDGSVFLSFGPDSHIINAALESPEFEPFAYTNGVGQLNDQIMRAEFANRLDNHGEGSSGWHTILEPSLSTARRMEIPFLTPTGGNAWYYFVTPSGQPIGAAIDADLFGSLLFPQTYPFSGDTPVGAAELAGDITTHDISTFLFNTTVLFTGGNILDCCIIGYHTYDFEPGIPSNGNRERRYVLNYSSWAPPGLFVSGFEDITPWSHEMAETFNDPFGNNLTPWWLSLDPSSGAFNCQNDLEVGDVVEVLTALPVYSIVMNGMTYHPQNVALFPWFAFESPSPAHLGAYSFPDETTLLALPPGPLLPGCVPAP